MQEKLRLEMSQEKTLITNAQDSAKFLGYEIYVRKDYATKRNSNGTVRRYFNGNVILHVSREVIKNKPAQPRSHESCHQTRQGDMGVKRQDLYD